MIGHRDDKSEPEVLKRLVTPRGELVLRRVDGHLEVISNGSFLMDTRDGRSERLLVTAALARLPSPKRLLIGGLGVGFSLQAACTDERLAQIVVVEVEPAVVAWHDNHLREVSHDAIADPRVTIVVADLVDHLRSATSPGYDAICLDTDNGPDWTVTPGNAQLYDDAGLELLVSRINPGGALSVWAAGRSPAYEARLGRHLDAIEIHEVAVPRGEPDVVMVGVRPGGVRR